MPDGDRLPPMEGLRVLDLSRVLAGPYCTALMADAGADVIKIESAHGDDARHLGPFRNGESVYFDMLNRRKRSISLNLKSADDHQIFLRLVRSADVVVENFRPGVTQRLGIDYATLSQINPRVVYASISGFGQDGPMAGFAAYDLVVQALSGIMSITGTKDSGPTRIGESFGDLIAGLFAAWGISTALVERSRSGFGQYLDVAMFDSLLAFEPTALSQLQTSGAAPGRVGNRHPVSTPFDTFRARDGLFVLAVASQSGFVTLTRTLDRPDLAADARFVDDTTRTVNQQVLRGEIEQWAQEYTVAEVVDRLNAAGLAASPIWNLDQALHSEQAQHRAVLRRFEHPVSGAVEFVGQPVRFSRSTEPAVSRSPNLGENGSDILAELDGLDDRPASPRQHPQHPPATHESPEGEMP